MLKNHILPTSLVLEYGDKIWRQKTRIVWMPYGEKHYDRRSNHVSTVYECDRQTERQTGRFTMAKTAIRIASRGKNVRLHILKGLNAIIE